MSQKKKSLDILELAARVSKVIEEQLKLALGLFMGAVVAASLWIYGKGVHRAREQKAFEELYIISQNYEQKKLAFEQAQSLEDKTKNKKGKKKEDETKAFLKPSKPLELPTGEIKQDYPQIIKSLEAFLNHNMGRNASGEGALLLSEIYAQYDMMGEGAQWLEKVLQEWGDQNIFYFVLQMRAGDLWAKANDCQKALPHWEVVAQSSSFIAPQAQLKLGVCSGQLERLDQARHWFEKVQGRNPSSSEAFMAKRYLRFLDFKSKTFKSKTKTP